MEDGVGKAGVYSVNGILEMTQLPLNQILCGDCIELMRSLPTASIDCIFADPPYNLQLQGELRRPDESLVDGVNDEWDKFKDFAEYDRFSREWLKEARRVLKKDATIWVIGSYHNIFRLGTVLQDLGFWVLNDIIWRKANPMPNFRGRRFTNAHETLIWAARGAESRYRFNYQAMKALNEDVQMRSDWYLPLCTGQERLKNKHGLKLHPTQKPESLLLRVLMASTEVDDVILDPFGGTGTTLAVARRLGRKFIGIERQPDYAEAAQRRVALEQALPPDQLVLTPDKRDAPRIPFGTLVERGVLSAGTVLMDKRKKIKATVTLDGNLVNGQQRGSIHKMGALLMNAPSCNGWTFWHVKIDGKWQELDVLRTKILQEMN